MRLFHVLATMLLLAGFAAAALTVSDDMCSDYNRTLCRQNRVNVDYNQSVNSIASDSSAGGIDPFASSRPEHYADSKKLEIARAPGCENDVIKVQVTYGGEPVPSANVQLYSLGGGRKLLAHTDTDSQGYAFFSQRKPGKYDILATKFVYIDDNAGSMTKRAAYPQGQIFFQIPHCQLVPAPSGGDGKSAGALQSPPSAANSADASLPAQTYPGGLSRKFEPMLLESGKDAVRVTVTYEAASPSSGILLSERIPGQVASSQSAIGFEHDYPIIEPGNNSMSLFWKIDKIEAGQEFSRSYVLMREEGAVKRSLFSSPAIILQNGSVVAGAGKFEPPANSASVASKSPLPLDAGIPILAAAIVLILAAAVLVFIILPMFGQRS